MTGSHYTRRTFLKCTTTVATGIAAITGSTATLAASEFVVTAPPRILVPVIGSDANFPVRRVYCLGLNYAAHTREAGQDPNKSKPFFFMKPTDAVVPGANTEIPYPSATQEFHYEVEFVIAIGEGGTAIAEADALKHVYGYSVGLDMTRRDLQAVAAKAGKPWEVSKSFDHSGPCAPIRSAADIGHPEKARIWLSVNDETRQDSDISMRIWSTARCIAEISAFFRLEPGDLIYTGTIVGSAAVQRGDVMRAGVNGVGELTVTVV